MTGWVKLLDSVLFAANTGSEMFDCTLSATMHPVSLQTFGPTVMLGD